jgi:hypothetical protein
MRRRLVLPLALLLALLGAGQASGAAFVTHHEQYWSWAGPKSWFASSGAYGISISDPKGTMGVDYGGSTTLCDGQPPQHFANTRAQIAANPSLKRFKIKKSRFQQSRDGTFFNTFQFSARDDGKSIKGEIKLAYADQGNGYCYASGLTKAGPAKGYGKTIKLLRQVSNSIAYFGPGLPIDPNTGLP